MALRLNEFIQSIDLKEMSSLANYSSRQRARVDEEIEKRRARYQNIHVAYICI